MEQEFKDELRLIIREEIQEAIGGLQSEMNLINTKMDHEFKKLLKSNSKIIEALALPNHLRADKWTSVE